MQVSTRTRVLTSVALIVLVAFPALGAPQRKPAPVKDGMSMYGKSEFIEKTQPTLTDETKALISSYKRNPSRENYLKLRAEVVKNYDAVLARKEGKLESLKKETAGRPGGVAKVAEMEEIVQEMYKTYWNRINVSMLRFTDPRLLNWRTSKAASYEYIPVMGAGTSIYVGRTQTTNAQYAEYLAATGRPAPSNWKNGAYPKGEDDFPVNMVSAEDVAGYCAWLTERDGVNVYRLPSEGEWELAAGHMPKDADFNCGVNGGRTPVEEYAKVTRGAHGAIDFWGNVWEWTSTARANGDLGVKGGAWNSPRTNCRTEYRKEGRDGSRGYEDVGFRVVQVLKGEEPEQKAELATLAAPTDVGAVSKGEDSVELTWKRVEGATEYQIFSYDPVGDHVEMLQTVEKTNAVVKGVKNAAKLRYIVEPISFTAVGDNVSGEYSVGVDAR